MGLVGKVCFSQDLKINRCCPRRKWAGVGGKNIPSSKSIFIYTEVEVAIKWAK